MTRVFTTRTLSNERCYKLWRPVTSAIEWYKYSSNKKAFSLPVVSPVTLARFLRHVTVNLYLWHLKLCQGEPHIYLTRHLVQRHACRHTVAWLVVGHVCLDQRNYSTPGPVSTGTGDHQRACKQPRFVTSHLGQLSLLPAAGRKTSTGQSVVTLCGWRVKAGMVHSTCR